MSLIEVRTRFSDETKKTIANATEADDQVGAMAARGAMKQLANELGLQLLAGFYSTAHDENIMHLRGDPAKIPLLQTVLNGSGAYEYARSDILIEGDEMRDLRDIAQDIQSRFNAPNRDEMRPHAARGMTTIDSPCAAFSDTINKKNEISAAWFA